MATKKLLLKDLRHKVILSRQEDYVEDTKLMLKRTGVKSYWAKIEDKKKSNFVGGKATSASRDEQTHEICIRYDQHVDVTAMAWLLEERLTSPSRWYKILGVAEVHDYGDPYYKFSCRLVRKNTEVTKEAPKKVGVL